jgi:hypothetical protein
VIARAMGHNPSRAPRYKRDRSGTCISLNPTPAPSTPASTPAPTTATPGTTGAGGSAAP